MVKYFRRRFSMKRRTGIRTRARVSSVFVNNPRALIPMTKVNRRFKRFSKRSFRRTAPSYGGGLTIASRSLASQQLALPGRVGTRRVGLSDNDRVYTSQLSSSMGDSDSGTWLTGLKGWWR